MRIEELTDEDWVRLEQLVGTEDADFLKEKYTDTFKNSILYLYNLTSIPDDFNRPFNEIPLYLETGSSLKKAILLWRLEIGL